MVEVEGQEEFGSVTRLECHFIDYSPCDTRHLDLFHVLPCPARLLGGNIHLSFRKLCGHELFYIDDVAEELRRAGIEDP